jgi:hypothetical protein
MGMARRSGHLIVASWLLVALAPVLSAASRAATSGLSVSLSFQGDITVRGCVERDAASRAPLFRLVEDPGTRIFRLTAPKDIDVASHVGHTVDVSGVVTPDAPGRQAREPELVVKKLVLVRASCSRPTSGP